MGQRSQVIYPRAGQVPLVLFSGSTYLVHQYSNTGAIVVVVVVVEVVGTIQNGVHKAEEP